MKLALVRQMFIGWYYVTFSNNTFAMNKLKTIHFDIFTQNLQLTQQLLEKLANNEILFDVSSDIDFSLRLVTNNFSRIK